jgi:hypothetical protein
MPERPTAFVPTFCACSLHAPVFPINLVLSEAEPRAVLVGNLPIAANGDPVLCLSPNKIYAGAAQVFVGYSEAPVAGRLHTLQHVPGPEGVDGTDGVQFGMPNVLVGGNTVVGDIAELTRSCKDLAKGRTSGAQQQTGGNCGIESMRQLINLKIAHENAARANRQPPEPPVPLKTEDDMLDDAIRDNADKYYVDFLRDTGNITPEVHGAQVDLYMYERFAAERQRACDEARRTSAPNADTQCAGAAAMRQTIKDNIAAGKYKKFDGTPITTQAEYDEQWQKYQANRDKFRNKALERSDPPNKLRESCGGTSTEARTTILKAQGFDVEEKDPSVEAIDAAIKNGNAVIISVNCGTLWGNTQTGPHAVVVTGMEYDDHGNVVGVVYNDTGVPCGCHSSASKATIDSALLKTKKLNVVKL